MQNRTVIYTAIFGNYDELQEPAFIPEGCDFICFSDKAQKSKHWQVRIIDMPVPGDSTRSNRRIKMLTHEYLPEYEYSVYIDGNVLVRGDMNELIRDYLSRVNMALYRHWSRDCIYDEAEAIIKLGKEKGRWQDDPLAIERQMARFRAEGYPRHNGLGTTSMLLRRHNEPDVRQVMETWWNIESKESKRDQLSFNYAAWKHNFAFSYISGYARNNLYFYRHKGHHRPSEKRISRIKSYLKQRVRLWSTYGFKFFCPFCGWRARKFYALGLTHAVLAEKQVIGAGRRDNAKCPKCGSKERERLIYLYLKQHGWFNVEKRRVLHVAPERNLSQTLREKYGASYVSTNYNPKKNTSTHADIQTLPFQDQSFDLIICSHVLEHVEDDALAMRELYRVLKPQGLAILQVPFSPLLKKTLEDSSVTAPEERARIFGQEDHTRLYGTDYVRRLQGAGFRACALLPDKFLSSKEIRKAALNSEEPLFLAAREKEPCPQ